MLKWITLRIDSEAHRKLHTAAVSKGKTLKDYLAAVLEQHASRLDVKVHDKDSKAN